MSTLGDKLTLLDIAISMAPDGTLASLAEVLQEDNEMLLDAVWQEANGVFSEKITRTASEPTGQFRAVSGGVTEETARDIPITEDLAILDSISKNDIVLVKASPSPEEYRMRKAAAHIRGMGKTWQTTLLYGNHDLNPKQFTGFAPRMASLVGNGRVLNNGGDADRTSIYIVGWGTDTIYMAYPKGSEVGLEHEDRGIELTDGPGGVGEFRAYVDYFSMAGGLVIADDRYMGRSANIKTTAGAASGLFDVDQIIRITNAMPGRGVRAALYMNQDVVSQIEIQAKDKGNVQYGPDDPFGRPVLYVRSNPVRLTDRITNAEDAVA